VVLGQLHKRGAYQPRPGSWRGRAQITDGHTTQSVLCEHPWLSDSCPGHGDERAARECGQNLAATLRAEHVDLATPLAAEVRALLEREFGTDTVSDEMVRDAVQNLDGTAPAPCGQDHSYLITGPGGSPLYKGAGFGQALEAAHSGFAGDGRFGGHVTARHAGTGTCLQEEMRVWRAALDRWLAGLPGTR
jgi:hypothetical protein